MKADSLKVLEEMTHIISPLQARFQGMAVAEALAEIRKTDRDRLIEICEKMNLCRTGDEDNAHSAFGTSDGHYFVGEVAAMANPPAGCKGEASVLIIGPSGDSYTGFHVAFYFDEAGNAVRHEIKE